MARERPPPLYDLGFFEFIRDRVSEPLLGINCVDRLRGNLFPLFEVSRGLSEFVLQVDTLHAREDMLVGLSASLVNDRLVERVLRLEQLRALFSGMLRVSRPCSRSPRLVSLVALRSTFCSRRNLLLVEFPRHSEVRVIDKFTHCLARIFLLKLFLFQVGAARARFLFRGFLDEV